MESILNNINSLCISDPNVEVIQNDGLQASQSWIIGSGRLEKAVGDAKASEVYDSIQQGRIETWLVHTLPDGSTSVKVLDAAGKPKNVDTSSILSHLGTNLNGAEP